MSFKDLKLCPGNPWQGSTHRLVRSFSDVIGAGAVRNFQKFCGSGAVRNFENLFGPGAVRFENSEGMITKIALIVDRKDRYFD